SCACRSVNVKMPFTAATSGSISEVMNPQAKNSVVTATNAARTEGLLIGYPPIRASRAPAANLPSGGRRGNRHVVDQPSPADSRGDEQARRCHAQALERFERLGVGQLDVVDAAEPAGDQRGPGLVEHQRDLGA